MQFIAVSYFDAVIGPALLAVAPAGKSLEYLERIPDLMNLYENEFFMHGIGDVTSANLIFNLTSTRERGGSIKMQLSIVVSDTDKSIDQDAAREYLQALTRAIDAVDGIDDGLTVNRSKTRDQVTSAIRSIVARELETLPVTIFKLRPTPVKILVFGARSTGKTSFLRQFTPGSNPGSTPGSTTRPANSLALATTRGQEANPGIRIERFLYGRFEVVAYDTPGIPAAMTSWEPYLRELDGIVLVLDGGRLRDADTMEAIGFLDYLMQRKEMARIPVLVLANKIDVSKPTIEDIAGLITRPAMSDSPVRVFYTSTISGEGAREALSWLLEKIAQRISPKGIELGFIFARMNNTTALDLIATYPRGIFVDPERIANRAFVTWQHVEHVRKKRLDKASYVLPFPQLAARVSINLDNATSPGRAGNGGTYLLAIIFKESIPDSIIEQAMATINKFFYYMMQNNSDSQEIENNLFLLHSALMEATSKANVASINSRSAIDAVFQQVFKSSLDAMLLMEARSRIIVDANDSAAKLVGLPKEDLIGNHVTQVFPEGNVDVEKHVLDRMDENGFSRSFVAIVTFAGNRLNIELEARRIRASGSMSLIHMTMRDQGTFLRLGFLERQHEELFRIINRSPVIAISWRVDPAVPGEKPVEFITENIRNLGYQPAEFYAGKITLENMIHPDDRSRVTATIARMMAIEGCEVIDVEYRIVKRNGETVPVKEIIEFQKDVHGKTFYQQSVLLDMTSHGDLACTP